MATRIFQPPERCADVAVDPVVLEAEPVQDLARLRLERVAAEVLVLLLHLAEAREDAVHVVRARGIAHRVVQLFELVVERAGAAAAGDRLVEHRPPGHLLDVLLEVADGELLRDGDVPFVGRLLADDHPEQRGLAGPVGSDKTDFLARIELERGVDEQDLPAVLLADLGEGNHAPSAYHRHPSCHPRRTSDGRRASPCPDRRRSARPAARRAAPAS